MTEYTNVGDFKVSKSDAVDKRIIQAIVYAPNMPDSDNEFMTETDIEKMAHEFLGSGKVNQIDTQHQNNLVQGARVIESFIARKGDPDYIEGSWVVSMKIENDDMWAKIKAGEINGFSIEAMVTKTKMVLELDIPPVVNGTTTKSEDHEHTFFVTFDNEGKFLGGRTNIEKGHFHNIRAGTMTESEQDHNHRFSFVENAYTNPVQLAAIMKSAAECGVYPHKVEEAPQMQVVAAVEAVATPVIEVSAVTAEALAIIEKADFPLAKEMGADAAADKEPDGDGDAPKLVEKPKKKFKLAVKEAVAEVLKSMGLQELVHKDWAKWNEDKKGGFANSGHQKMIDHHEAQASEHQDKYTETEGAEGDAHKAAASSHEFAASRHREAFRKLQVNPAGVPDHQKVYDASKNKAEEASEKANAASKSIKG